jgi:membrane-bound serine protease (ClpP class)
MQTVLILGALLSQLPNLEPPKFEEVKKDGEKKESVEEQKSGPKTYVKPEKKALPEGDAEVLAGDIALIEFDGMVNPGMGEFTLGAIARAEQEKKQALLIELDTPGGLVSTTQDMVKGMMAAKIPIIVFVTPSGSHAASAGTFITLASHVAAMSPATRIGAAHPVTGSGADPEAEGGKHMAKKIENDLVALVEGIAKERSRNADWAKDAVLESVSATADAALEIGIIDFIARDRDELFEKLEGHQLMIGGKKVELRTKGVPVTRYEQPLRSWLLNLLASPGVFTILMMLGVLGIILEVKAPGTWIPGIFGVLCILLAVISMGELPVDVGALILIVAGVGLMIAEFWTPTFGLLAVLGGIATAIGMVLLVDISDPEYAIDPTFRLSFVDVLPVVITMVGFTFFLSYFVVRSKQMKPVTGSEGLVGARGKVLKPVGPGGGQVFVGGEYWQAKSSESIALGEEVEVVKVEGLSVEVRRRN